MPRHLQRMENRYCALVTNLVAAEVKAGERAVHLQSQEHSLASWSAALPSAHRQSLLHLEREGSRSAGQGW